MMICQMVVGLAVAQPASKQDEIMQLASQLSASCPTLDTAIVRQDAELLVNYIEKKRLEKLAQKGEALVNEGEQSFNKKTYLACIEKAAQLPSEEGLKRLGEWYQLQAADATSLDECQQWIEQARVCYQQRQDLFDKLTHDSDFIADFYSVLDSGDTLYFSWEGDPDGETVSVCTPTMYRCNMTGPRLVIPEEVYYHGHRYKVTRIDDDAFRNDFALRHVTLPQSLNYIGFTAFKNCIRLDTIVFTGGNLTMLKNAAFPVQPALILPDTMSKDMVWNMNFHLSSISLMLEKTSSMAYDRQQIINNYLGLLEQLKDYGVPSKYYSQKGIIYLDPLVDEPERAVQCWLQGAELDDASLYEDIGDYYHTFGDYEKAFKYYQLGYDNGRTVMSGNRLALMYARGEGVKQDFKKALKLVDASIAAVKDPSCWYNLKGCIYMMMGRRHEAEACYEKGPEPYSFMYYFYHHYVKPEFPSLKDMLYPEEARPNVRSEQADSIFMAFKDEKQQTIQWMAGLLAQSLLEFYPYGRYCNNRDYDELVNVAYAVMDSTETQQNNYTLACLNTYRGMMRKVMALGANGSAYRWYSVPDDLMDYAIFDSLNNYQMLAWRPFVMLHEKMHDLDTCLLNKEQIKFKSLVEKLNNTVETRLMAPRKGKDRDMLRDLLFEHRNPAAVEREYGVDAEYIRQLLNPKKEEETE